VYPEMSASRSVPRPAPECSSEVTSFVPSAEREQDARHLRRAHNRIEACTSRHGTEATQHGSPARAAGIADEQALQCPRGVQNGRARSSIGWRHVSVTGPDQGGSK
jgi:hypothetical protein